MTINWSEVLADRGVDVDSIKAEVQAAEDKLQAEQKAFHEERKIEHDPTKHGLDKGKVAAIVKKNLSDVQFAFCGKDFIDEVWEQL